MYDFIIGTLEAIGYLFVGLLIVVGFFAIVIHVLEWLRGRFGWLGR